MNEEENQMSREESFRIIDSMIGQARNQMNENGHLYLLWGWVVFTCSLGQFCLQHILKVEYYWSVWLLTWLAVAHQVVYLKKRAGIKRVQNYTDDILRYVWLVFAILMILMSVQFSRVTHTPDQINAPILILYGMPTFLSGIILKFRPLVIGGIACWLLSLLALWIPAPYYLLLVAASITAGWIVPGYMLRIRYKKAYGH